MSSRDQRCPFASVRTTLTRQCDVRRQPGSDARRLESRTWLRKQRGRITTFRTLDFTAHRATTGYLEMGNRGFAAIREASNTHNCRMTLPFKDAVNATRVLRGGLGGATPL
jgi:hypothetical protein